MVKRYCDKCGQQIDDGVHSWYVIELHGTDGELRHKEMCEECYATACEDGCIPKVVEQTEPQKRCGNCRNYQETSVTYIDGSKTFDCPYADTWCDEDDKACKRFEPKDEPRTDTDLILEWSCSFSECNNFNHFGLNERCVKCKQMQRKMTPIKTETQTKREGE